VSKVPRNQIASAIATKTLMSGVSSKLSREVAAYLLSEGRVGELDPLMRDIQSQWAEAGYVNAVAISAHPINAGAKAKIRQTVASVFPKAKKIIINEQYDADVVAGVRIELADRQLDVSVATKLNKFRQLTAGKD
jgi:F0F1-type ATP synthase delta subunit